MKSCTRLVTGLLYVAAFAYSGVLVGASKPELMTTLTGPSSPLVYAFNYYVARVTNSGRANASSVVLKVKLPLTGTSPQVYVLGEVQSSDPRCSIINRELSCNLSTINKNNAFKEVSFRFKFPQSSRALSLEASVTCLGELNTGNNSASLQPTIEHPNLAIDQSVVVTNSHCTGSSQLSSYFECLLFPSSISNHVTNFESNGDITLTDQPTFTGHWEQNPTTKNLSFSYFDNGEKVAEFTGFAVDDKCFEGMVQFFPASNYTSAYRVCLP